ncbi:MAG TPA: type II secretion system protein N [Myxococcales bacterium]|nr:type II secretion system protein N [Myxococcales bacterium]
MTGALRRPGVRLAVLGIAAYLAFLLVNLPAAWLGFALERSSRGALALGDPAGTLWKGKGLLALRSGGAFRGVADLEWSCNPLSVLTGRLGVALSGVAPETRLRASVSLGPGSVRFQNVEANAPASLLEPAIPAAAFAKPDGRLRVLADSLEIGPAGVSGAATVEWLEAGMSGLQRLGDYRLQITGNGERAEMKLATLRGDLRLNGTGEWRAAQPRVVQLRGTAEASAERKDLEPLLQMLGIRGPGIPQPFSWTVPI